MIILHGKSPEELAVLLAIQGLFLSYLQIISCWIMGKTLYFCTWAE